MAKVELIKPFITTLKRTEALPLSLIEGVKELKPGMKFKSGMVPGIKVVDKDTLEVKLGKINPTFIYSLGFIVPALGPIDSFQDDLYTPKTIPIGCGPFKIVWSDPNSTLVRVKRVTDSDKSLPLTIDFISDGNATSNKVDLAIGSGTQGLDHNTDYRMFGGDITKAVQVLDFNYANRLGQNKHFREAITHAINKPNLIKRYQFLRVTSQLIPDKFLGRSPEINTYDIVKAKITLNMVDKPYNKIKALYHGTKKLSLYLKVMKEQLKKIGIEVEFVQTDQIWFNPGDKNYAFYVFGNTVDFADPLVVYAHYNPLGVSPLHTDSSDEKFEELYRKVSTEFDQIKRAEFIRLMTQHFRENYRMIPLFERVQIFAVGPRIKSIGREKLLLTFNYDLVKLK